MAEPIPLILTDCSLKISTDGTALGLTELACNVNHLELSPDVSVTTLDTFCGSKDYPGVVKWSLIATLYQSFDADATEEVLSAAVELGTPTPFEIVPYKSKPVGPTNPSWTGDVIPKVYAPINGDAGDASTVELEWSLTGPPVKSIVPGPQVADGVEIRGLDELSRALPRFGDQLTRDLDKAGEEAARQAASTARGTVPRRSGRLASSVSTDSSPAAVTLGEGVPYAGWIEYGGTRGRPYVPDGRYLYPAAQGAQATFQAAGERQTSETIRGFPWPHPS